MKKRVLGIAAGRVNGNSELLLKHALKAIEDEGHEVQFLRLHDYYIKPCVGCEACTMLLSSGKPPRCKYGWEEDDMKFITDQIKASQGLIIAAPSYHLMPPGILTVLLNRLHCCGFDNHSGRAAEGDESNRRICATIAVGGSDWISMQLPVQNFMATELIGSQMHLVDQMEIHGAPAVSVVALRDDAIERATQLGKNVAAELVTKGKPTYHGTVEECCPICHTNLLCVGNGRVTCPFCDVAGDPVIEDGKLTVKWDGGIEVSRWSKHGTRHHDEAMKRSVVLVPGKGYVFSDEQKKIVKETVDHWKNYLDPIMPPR